MMAKPMKTLELSDDPLCYDLLHIIRTTEDSHLSIYNSNGWFQPGRNDNSNNYVCLQLCSSEMQYNLAFSFLKSHSSFFPVQE